MDGDVAATRTVSVQPKDAPHEARSKKNIRRTIHNALLATTMTSREMASITGIEHAVLMRALWEMVDDEKVDAVYSFRRGVRRDRSWIASQTLTTS